MQRYVGEVLSAEILGMIAASPSAWAANLIKDGGFEKPKTPPGSYTLYSTGQQFSKWSVTGAPGNVATISTTFMQDGFTFLWPRAAKLGLI